MSITTTITRTHQGVWVQSGPLDCDCTLGKRMDGTTGLCIDGNLSITDEAIRAAVIAMFAEPKGTKQAITTGEATDNTAELAAYEAHHAAVLKAMEE